MMHMRPRDLLALCLSAFGLGGCPTPAPSDPPILFVDASDAATLLDAGPNPDTCALACASWARAHCQEATGNCRAVCVTGSAHGLYSSRMLGCVVDAGGDRGALQLCDLGMCP